MRNWTSTAQTVSLQGCYGSAKLNFGGHTILPGATWVAQAAVTIASPHLWAPGDPYLYRARLTLSDAAGRRLEGYTDFSGIRNIAVGPGGQLLLNGRVLDLRGFDLHELNIQTGAALSTAQLQAVVGWVRDWAEDHPGPLSARPPDRGDGRPRRHPAVVGDPGLPGELPVPDPLRLAQPAHTMLRTNILTNENHPSVLVWSIANELTTPPDDAEARYIAGASQLAHQLDPTRPVGMAISNWPGVVCQAAYAPLDVIGFNDYFGWFDAGGGGTDDPDQLSPFLDYLHGCYPTKPLMITEFGFEGSQNGPPESGAPTSIRPPRRPSISGCSPPSPTSPARCGSPSRTSPPGPAGAAAIPSPTRRSWRRARSTCRATRCSPCSRRSSRSTPRRSRSGRRRRRRAGAQRQS